MKTYKQLSSDYFYPPDNGLAAFMGGFLGLGEWEKFLLLLSVLLFRLLTKNSFSFFIRKCPKVRAKYMTIFLLGLVMGGSKSLSDYNSVFMIFFFLALGYLLYIIGNKYIDEIEACEGYLRMKYKKGSS